MTSLFFRCLVLCALIAAGAETVLAQWRAVSTSREMNISGMALVQHNEQQTTFIVVHDNKKRVQPHAGLLTFAGRQPPSYTSLEWVGNDVPVDLEAITSVPEGPSGTFIAFTSAGSGYHIRLDQSRNRVEVIKAFNVPSIPAGSDFEGFALQTFGGSLLAVWADRGLSANPATLYWSRFDLQTYAFVQLASAKVRVPYPTANVRHISDVKVDSTGAVFISAASDPGNDGPFSSAVYYAGSFSFSPVAQVSFLQPATLTRLFQFTNHKIEALEFVPGPKGGVAFGTDDENLGAAIYLDW